jgi:hypothetical protein
MVFADCTRSLTCADPIASDLFCVKLDNELFELWKLLLNSRSRGGVSMYEYYGGHVMRRMMRLRMRLMMTAAGHLDDNLQVASQLVLVTGG